MRQAIRTKSAREPATPDDGVRIYATASPPAGRAGETSSRWLPALAAPGDFKQVQMPRDAPARALKGWLAAPKTAAALSAVAELAVRSDITLVGDAADPDHSHLPLLRAAVAAQAVKSLAEDALRRTRRFDAILCCTPQIAEPIIAGITDRAEELASLVEAIAASGQELAMDGEDEAAARSPQCYLGLGSAFGMPLVQKGRTVGAVVADSGQIGRFSLRELSAIRDLAPRVARLLA